MDLHFYEKLIDYRNRQGMAPQIGAQMTKITEGHAWAELTVQPNQQNLIGSVHGGILMTFADVVAAAAAWSYGSHITTQECSIHFLNAAIHVDKLLAEGIVEKHGKRIFVVRVEITDPTGQTAQSITKLARPPVLRREVVFCTTKLPSGSFFCFSGRPEE